jgi:hypothetical protein
MHTVIRYFAGFAIVLALGVDGCTADTGIDVPPLEDGGADAGAPAERVVWECDCWTKYIISPTREPVLREQNEIPNGLRCAYEDPTDALADALCAIREEYCDCSHCVPTGRLCGESR